MSNKKTINRIAPKYRSRVGRIIKLFRRLSDKGTIVYTKKLRALMCPWNKKMKRVLYRKNFNPDKDFGAEIEKSLLAEAYLENSFFQEFMSGKYNHKKSLRGQ